MGLKQMISSFTSIASHLLVIALSLSAAVANARVSGADVSPSRDVSVQWDCIDELDCRVSVDQKGKVSELISAVPIPAVSWYAPSLGEVRVSCGSPCYYSFFVSDEQISEGFSFVIAVDEKRSRFFVVDGQEVKMFRMFGPSLPQYVFELDFSPSATPITVIRSADITNEGNLRIRYMSGMDFTMTTEVLKIYLDTD